MLFHLFCCFSKSNWILQRGDLGQGNKKSRQKRKGGGGWQGEATGIKKPRDQEELVGHICSFHLKTSVHHLHWMNSFSTLKYFIINNMSLLGNQTLSIQASNLISNWTVINSVLPFSLSWFDREWQTLLKDRHRHLEKREKDTQKWLHVQPQRAKKKEKKKKKPPWILYVKSLTFRLSLPFLSFLISPSLGAWDEHSRKCNEGNVSWNPRKKSGRKLTFWHLQRNGR